MRSFSTRASPSPLPRSSHFCSFSEYFERTSRSKSSSVLPLLPHNAWRDLWMVAYTEVVHTVYEWLLTLGLCIRSGGFQQNKKIALNTRGCIFSYDWAWHPRNARLQYRLSTRARSRINAMNTGVPSHVHADTHGGGVFVCVCAGGGACVCAWIGCGGESRKLEIGTRPRTLI